MKILFLVSSLGSGGAERVATTLCNAWVARGWQVTLMPTFSGGGSPPAYRISGSVELVFLADLAGVRRRSLTTYLKRLLALRKLIATRSPDVVVSFLPNVNVAAVMASSSLEPKLIICERSDPTAQPLPAWLNVACRLLYRYADVLTVQTEAVVAKLGRFYSRTLLVRSIPNPLPDGIVAIERNPVTSRRKKMLSLGRLSPEKQVNLIIESFSLVAPLHDDWDLHIYGEGPLKQDLERQISRLGLQSRVFLDGLTSEPWQVMADSDAFVLASRFEGFPNALLEAMGVGLPCITFDCPSGPREISNDGRDALLVELNDLAAFTAAFRKLMESSDFRNELGARARNSVLERYSLASVLSRWDELFREIGIRS